MASVIISEHTQVMLLTEPTFAAYASQEVADAAKTMETILVLEFETRAQVDDLAGTAGTAGGGPAGAAREEGGRYQRAFTDPDGHHWEALCLVGPGA